MQRYLHVLIPLALLGLAMVSVTMLVQSCVIVIEWIDTGIQMQPPLLLLYAELYTILICSMVMTYAYFDKVTEVKKGRLIMVDHDADDVDTPALRPRYPFGKKLVSADEPTVREANIAPPKPSTKAVIISKDDQGNMVITDKGDNPLDRKQPEEPK